MLSERKLSDDETHAAVHGDVRRCRPTAPAIRDAPEPGHGGEALPPFGPRLNLEARPRAIHDGFFEPYGQPLTFFGRQTKDRGFQLFQAPGLQFINLEGLRE